MRRKNRPEGTRDRRRREGESTAAVLERLEDRRLRADWDPLMTYTELRDELWGVGWSVLFGTVQVGNASQGIASMEVGGAQSRTYSYASLDDSGGRFDSGWRQFWFHADVSGGSASWYVEGTPQVWHASGEIHTSVTEVIVVAAVARP